MALYYRLLTIMLLCFLVSFIEGSSFGSSNVNPSKAGTTLRYGQAATLSSGLYSIFCSREFSKTTSGIHGFIFIALNTICISQLIPGPTEDEDLEPVTHILSVIFAIIFGLFGFAIFYNCIKAGKRACGYNLGLGIGMTVGLFINHNIKEAYLIGTPLGIITLAISIRGSDITYIISNSFYGSLTVMQGISDFIGEEYLIKHSEIKRGSIPITWAIFAVGIILTIVSSVINCRLFLKEKKKQKQELLNSTNDLVDCETAPTEIQTK